MRETNESQAPFQQIELMYSNIIRTNSVENLFVTSDSKLTSYRSWNPSAGQSHQHAATMHLTDSLVSKTRTQFALTTDKPMN